MDTSQVSAGATLVAAALLAAWLADTAPSLPLILWYVALVALSAGRFAFKVAFDRRFEARHVERWEFGYGLILALTGVAWGSVAWLPAPGREYGVVLCLAVVLVVSANTLVASQKTFVAFGAGVLLPLIAAQLARQDQLGFYLALGSAALGLVALLIYRSHYRILAEAIASRYRSQDLLWQHRVIFESAGEGIVFIKPKPEYTVECNARFAEMLGYPRDQMMGMEPARWHPDRAQWRSLVVASLPVIGRGQAFHQVMRLCRADGSLFWADTTGMAVVPANPSAGTVWVISDITEKRATESALRLSEQRFRDLVKISSDVYWEQDQQFRFTKFDGKDEVLQRLPLENFLGRTRWDIEILGDMSPQEWEEHRAILERHEPFRDLVYPIVTAEGQKRWLTVSGNPLFDDSGRFMGYHGVSSDITNRVQSEERYRHLAFHDALTQLPNRRLLEDRLERAIFAAGRNRHKVALLLLDLDGFKQINDVHGHAIGDMVLKAVALRLSGTVRESDTVARLGGDEFVVVLREIVDTDAALRVAEKIHDVISAPMMVEDRELQVGTSIGIAIYPEHGGSPTQLLDHADAAMYRSKHIGGRLTRLYGAEQ